MGGRRIDEWAMRARQRYAFVAVLFGGGCGPGRRRPKLPRPVHGLVSAAGLEPPARPGDQESILPQDHGLSSLTGGALADEERIPGNGEGSSFWFFGPGWRGLD